MQLSHTEDEVMLADQARRYLKDRYPFAGRRARLEAGGHDPQVWQDFASFGWLGLGLPEALGGAGLGPGALLALAAELGRALVTEPFVACAVESASLLAALAQTGSARGLAADLAAGRALVLAAHAEEGARHHPHHVGARAAAAGGVIHLSGRKMRLAHADRADVFLVSARETGGPREATGISLFQLPAARAVLTEPAVRLLDGTTARDLVLDGIELTEADRLGPPGGAAPALGLARSQAILALAGMSVGSMEALVGQTARYLDTRVQFGRALSSFQALRHRLADMAISTERARSAAWLAANALASGGEGLARSIAVAKAECALAGRRTGQAAVQLHGGIGTTEELEVGHHLCFLEMTGVRFGDRAFHLATIVGELRAAGTQHNQPGMTGRIENWQITEIQDGTSTPPA